jgi:hypothetical protein
MTASDLENRWLLISNEKVANGYKSLRLPSECTPEVFLGVGPNGQRCLILFLPKLYKLDFNAVEKEKISIELDRHTNYLVLSLQDPGYFDLFDDLIISLYNVIKDISDVDIYAKVFIQTFNRWNAFFEDADSDRLDKDTIKGLFGELQVLKDLLEETDSSKVNSVLDSWKGPYDTGHDFVMDDKNIEVKTKDLTKPDVSISSEAQLEGEYGKGHELLVLSVEQNLENGSSLKDLFYQVKELAIGMGGDTAILVRAISQKGLNQKNIHEYDNFRFKLCSEDIYDCLKDNFPRLVKSEIGPSITNVKYNLNLKGLDGFRLSSREF